MPSFQARVTSVLYPLQGAAHLTQRHFPKARWAFATFFFGLGHPAHAMDCGKAALPTEKAICSDPAALAADQALGMAYSALSARLTESEKKQLLQSQRAWLKQRTNMCLGENNKPDVKCLAERTQRRAIYLQGKPESGPGTGHDLTPVIVEQAATKTLYEQDITASKFSSPELPGEKLFNTTVEKLLKDAPSGKDKDDSNDADYSYDIDLRVTYASPKFLSASLDTYSFEGGAHGNGGTSGINIDVVKGKTLTFADSFNEATHKKLGDLCFAQIKAQKKEKDMDLEGGLYTVAELRKTIADGLSSFERWSFSATKGTVTFNAYELGSYAEGSYECSFTTEILRPLYVAGSILP